MAPVKVKVRLHRFLAPELSSGDLVAANTTDRSWTTSKQLKLTQQWWWHWLITVHSRTILPYNCPDLPRAWFTLGAPLLAASVKPGVAARRGAGCIQPQPV